YEVSPNLVYTGHGWFTTAMMANQDFFDGLSEEDQQLVREASEHSYEVIIEHISGLAEESLNKIQEASSEVTVTRLNEEQIEAFRERAPQVEERFIEMTGERGSELLDQFKADLEAVSGE
ncbi:MAG: C4-dicarboxylate ABC transporter, partial [Halomonadaceae bacterium]|nr:C4-dicarboxylate ABC transporter [Halomonadaceae bacterium]